MDEPERQLQQLIELRRLLHRKAEPSGQEHQSAEIMARFLKEYGPDEILTGLGGHGLAVIFKSPHGPGPTVMLRAELDALPISEFRSLPWASQSDCCAHKCGHDGHMAILAGVAQRLQKQPPSCGAVILLFQPAEETGHGAAELLADPRFQVLKPDWVFALHNLPGHPSWSILTRPGAFAAGSVGVRIKLTGKTSHAAYPQQGNSPDLAMAELVTGLVNLTDANTDALALVTVVHARLGTRSFGVSPGDAEVLATIRSDRDDVLELLKIAVAELVKTVSNDHGLSSGIEYCEEFPVTMNDPQSVEIICRVAEELDLEVEPPEESPFRWSEDFGHLIKWADRGAMFGLGAGLDHPVLHGPDYDFDDDLILPGVTVLERIYRVIQEKQPSSSH